MSIYPTALQDKTLIHRGEDETTAGPVRAERTDAQLAELIVAGDESAFESLFERHGLTKLRIRIILTLM